MAATIKPTADSDIKIEVWMPASGWNGKFLGVVGGGFAGVISYNAMGAALERDMRRPPRIPGIQAGIRHAGRSDTRKC